MKNSQKKFLSAILAASSVAGVVAPATALAATTDVQTLVDNALRDKTFYSFNVAYGAIIGLPAAEQAQYLAQIAPLEAVVRTADIDTVLRQIDKFYDTQDMSIHDNVLYKLIPQVKAQVDRDYLQYELYKWGKVFIEQKQPEYIAATDAIIAVDTQLQAGKLSDSVAKVDAANAAIAKVGHAANNAYAKTLLAEVQGRLDKALDAVTLKVNSVEATAKDTIVIKGEGLKALQASDITADNNTVSSVTVNADRTQATVKLASSLYANQDVDVTVKGEAYTVNYALTAETVTVDDATFDDDTTKQVITLKLNGQTTTVEELEAAGYSVQFTAFDDDDSNVTDTFFYDVDDDGTASTPRLADSLTIGDYTVQVVLSNATDVISSDKATIKVKNLSSTATSISAYELTNYGVGEEYADGFKQNSTKMVEGEVAAFTQVTVNGDDIDIDPANNTDEAILDVESSDESVVSVANDGKITAEAPGTAKVTFTYGNATKTITITVDSEKRKIDKVKAESSTVKTVVNKTTDAKLNVLDQYGDSVPLESSLYDNFTIVQSPSTDKIVQSIGDLAATADDEDYDLYLPIEGYSDNGSISITFKYKETTVGTIKVTNTKVDNIDTKKLELQNIKDYSTDTTLAQNSTTDGVVRYKIAQYNTAGVKNGYADLSNYTIKVADEDIVQTEVDPDGTYVDILPQTVENNVDATTGSTTVSFYDADGTYVAKLTIKVVAGSNEVKSVTWKTTTTVDYAGELINFKDVLSNTGSSNDTIINGITLADSSAFKVRITSDAKLYLDKDGDGTFTDADTQIGTLEAVATSGSEFDYSDPVAGYTTAAGDDGTIVFKIKDMSQNTVASKSLKVDVAN